MIEQYSFGQIVIDGSRYTTDVIIYPDGHVDYNWWRKDGHYLSIEDILEVAGRAPEWLVVGTGEEGMMKIDPQLKEDLADRGIELEALPTHEAVQLYNDLAGVKTVAACLHLTC